VAQQKLEQPSKFKAGAELKARVVEAASQREPGQRTTRSIAPVFSTS
jgi:hypothetical protein